MHLRPPCTPTGPCPSVDAEPETAHSDGGSDRLDPVDTGAESDNLDRENADEHVETDADDDDFDDDGSSGLAITQG